MCRKLVLFVSFVLVLGLVWTSAGQDVDPSLVGWWKFDEGIGTTTADSSGNENHGTLIGPLEWTDGYDGKALSFDGLSNYVLVQDSPSLNMTDAITIAAWINPSWTGNNRILQKSSGGGDNQYRLLREWGDNMVFHLPGLSSDRLQFPGLPSTGEWTHLVATYDGSSMKVYYNAVAVGEMATSGQLGTTDGTLCIGTKDEWALAGDEYHGMLDNVRIYNRALSQSEIKLLEDQLTASRPAPTNRAIHEDTWASMSWKVGSTATSHDVYFGENAADVEAGTGDTFRGNQTSLYFIAGIFGYPYPDGLVPGTTYYWRVDEVEADGETKHTGDVWSFTVPPKKAYNPVPADNATSVEVEGINLAWTAGLGASLYSVYFSGNFDEVNNVTGSPPLPIATYTPGPLKMAKTYYWRVDEFVGGRVAETHKGDLWSFTTQGAVGSPSPANGAVNVTQTAILSWSQGFFGISHEVYFGTDKDAVRNADASSLEYKGSGNYGSERYDPGKLEWDTTYYWRVDETDNANPDSPWTGPVWSFTTADFIIVDDFESYDDLYPDHNRIFRVWIDGLDDPDVNGSVVGYDKPPFAEQTIVHSGNQSMPMSYDNAVGISEATKTLTYPCDWTENGVEILVIWYKGETANAAEPMYVALNDSAVVTNENPDAAQVNKWTEWNIDLQKFADQGVDLADVNSITLGLGDRSNPIAGGSGKMYFDDIRLYQSRSAP
jgi:hypothetical protein